MASKRPTSAPLILDAPAADNLPSAMLAGGGQRRIESESLFEVVQNYVEYYAAGQSHTARAKRYDLQHFLEFLATHSGQRVEKVRVSDWTLQATKDFIEDRLAQGEAPTTASRRLATIKHFGRTLAERFHGYINPAREVKAPTVRQSRPHELMPREVEYLRQAAREEVAVKKGGFLAVRNRMLLELLLATGLRADEVRLLTIGQVSEDGEWLSNVRTKGKKFRNVYLDSAVRDDFADYLALRKSELESKFPGVADLSAPDQNRMPVFIGFHSARLTRPSSFGLAPKTIWRIIASFGKKAQALSPTTLKNLHPHLLRHSFAHGLLNSSKDVRLVAQALGHSDVRITMRYTERTDQEVAAAIEKKVQQNN